MPKHVDRLEVTHEPPCDIVLLGFGRIGRELAAQLAQYESRANGTSTHVRIAGVIDRSGYVSDAEGLSPHALRALVRAKRGGTALAQTRHGIAGDAASAIAAIGARALTRPILVDVTAGETTALLASAATTHGMDIVLANKRPLADDCRAELARTAESHGRRVRHEATVGAGLPIIDTIDKLIESGDRIIRIEGCPSGTLGYVFGELGRGTSFSAAVRAAMGLGYTEPDPRDDLSGADVARKALILGRMIGFSGGLGDVSVTSLVPAKFRALDTRAFVERLTELDAAWAAKVNTARAAGRVLRYRATVTRGRASVRVVAVNASTPLGILAGTDNQFTITTMRYRANPLVISGPGAGAAVTAAGVLNDVLRLAGSTAAS